MIKIYISDNEIKVTGHSLPDICASVSSAMYITINNLIHMQTLGIDKGECIIEDNLDDDFMSIKIKKHSKITDILINTLINGLQDISDDSENFVKIIKSQI